MAIGGVAGDGSGSLRVSGLRNALAGPFDLVVGRGSTVTMSGSSGSGKSLFLRMLADLDPCVGEVSLDGIARDAVPASAWRSRVTYVAAEPGWWTDTPEGHFEPEHRTRAARLAERLGVASDRLRTPIDMLSTGERQRLALIRAIVADPPVLLLDEPTGPLDPASAGLVEALLVERAAAGGIAVVASHDPGQGARLGARCLRMVDRVLSEVL